MHILNHKEFREYLQPKNNRIDFNMSHAPHMIQYSILTNYVKFNPIRAYYNFLKIKSV